MERLNLLVCDLDGTLLGDDRALDDFAEWYVQARSMFRLAYSSGRFVASIFDSIDAANLPTPDAIIGGVGTEIYDVSLGRRISMWPPTILGWNPHIVRDICESHPELTPQPRRFLSYHKVSYYGPDLDESFIDQLMRQMAAAGQHATAVYSSNRDLDLLPADAHKGAAADFLARRWKIDPERVIVAGDSGNDATMFDQGFRGITVGNAHAELRSLAAPHIYHATAEFAAGVLEGLDYWLQAAPQSSARSDPSTADRRANHGRRG
jgi:mannosylfructose-6-phosphate phosphatase